MGPAGDQSGDMGRVEEEQRPHLVGDGRHRRGIDGPRIRRGAGDEHPGPVTAGEIGQDVVVDPLVGRVTQ